MKTHNKKLASLIIGCILILAASPMYGQENNTSTLMERAKAVGIEEVSLNELQNRAQDKGVSQDHLSQILQAALDMSDQNLPADMVINKALEGLSKGVPSERITSAVNMIKGSMMEASQIVDPWINRPNVRQMVGRSGESQSSQQFRSEMTRAVSASLMQNVSAEVVNKVLSKIDSESILSNTNTINVTVAISILSDLPTTAEQPEVSAEFIARALKRGFEADQLQKLPTALRIGQQRSELPAASVVNQVASQIQEGIPAKQILQNLFNGNIGGGPPGDLPRGLDNKQDRGGSGNNG